MQLHTSELATVHRNSLAHTSRLNALAYKQERRALGRTQAEMPEWRVASMLKGEHACAVNICQYDKDWLFGQDYYLRFDNEQQAQGFVQRLAGGRNVGYISEQWASFQR